jgi:hypothetical protein
MSHRRARAPLSREGYIELHGQDEDEQEADDPRSSINSHSPILPKSEIAESNQESVDGRATFDTSGLESHYKPVDGYEGAHRYDPSYSWEPVDEQRVVRKV